MARTPWIKPSAAVAVPALCLSLPLWVPGGAADAGAYAGNITWTLVDAP